MKKELSHIPKECVAYNFTKTARHLASFYRKIINRSGLQGMQFQLLLAIRLYEPVSISVLAKKLEIDRTTLSRNLKRLEKNALVNFENAEDQRIHNVQLSESGNKILTSALPLWEEAQNLILDRFGTDNWHQLLDSMNKLERIIS
ncbi:MAG: MarR family winged helix-turn-helix transcriptional regulator [Desulfobulbaceae bacterium]|nr:MarR family winged helix-turn-helix transcriptional regulator [Desulfobulbaceae bacterium]